MNYSKCMGGKRNYRSEWQCMMKWYSEAIKQSGMKGPGVRVLSLNNSPHTVGILHLGITPSCGECMRRIYFGDYIFYDYYSSRVNMWHYVSGDIHIASLFLRIGKPSRMLLVCYPNFGRLPRGNPLSYLSSHF